MIIAIVSAVFIAALIKCRANLREYMFIRDMRKRMAYRKGVQALERDLKSEVYYAPMHN